MTRNGLYGTDLGYTVSYRGRVYFLFGDTWVPTASGGGAAVAPRASDDAMAWTTDTKPDDCLSLRSVIPSTSLTAAVTPDESLPAVPLPVGSRWAAITIKDNFGHSFFTPEFSTPVGTFSANDKIYVLFLVNTGDDPHPHGVYLAASTGTGAGFSGQALVSPSNGKFINLATVDNPSDTANVYVLGSPAFFTGGPLYLQRHAKGTLAPNGSWQGWYWKGGSWASGEKSAVPLGVEAGAKKFEEEPLTQFSVQWVPSLARYVMIYGATAGFNFGVSPELDLTKDQVFVRTASQLQGPWSAPAAVFGRLSDGGYCHWMRVATSHPKKALCGAMIGTGQTVPGWEEVTGFTYGVSLLPSAFAKTDAGVVTLYFAMSTFNPYQVMLMKVRIKN